MRRSQRLIAAAVLVALSGALGGCSSGISNLDPTDLLDFLDTKKKLPGERKPVFPDGVPGLEQGVPKELYKGSAQERQDQQNAEAAAAAAAAPARGAEVETRREIQDQGQAAGRAATAPAQDLRPRRMPMRPPRRMAARPRRRRRQSRRKSRASAPPRRRPISRRATGASRSRAAQPPQQSAAPFPAPLPSGTFAR